jgi:hypothetical protein
MNIPAFAAASARLDARAAVARHILDEIEGDEWLLPIAFEEFNDDDIYIYDPATLKVVQQIGASSAGAIAFRGVGALGPVPAGMAWAKGMTAKRLGLRRAV